MNTKRNITIALGQGEYLKFAVAVTDLEWRGEEFYVHRMFNDSSYSVTEPRTGVSIGKSRTKQGAIDTALKNLNGLGSVEAWHKAFAPIVAAPYIDTVTEEKGKEKVANVVPKLVAAIEESIDGELTQEEREAVTFAFCSKGKNKNRLKVSAPNSFDFPLANVAWNALQPNAYKVQICNLMMMSKEAETLYKKLKDSTLPAIFDKDMSALKALGVW